MDIKVNGSAGGMTLNRSWPEWPLGLDEHISLSISDIADVQSIEILDASKQGVFKQICTVHAAENSVQGAVDSVTKGVETDCSI